MRILKMCDPSFTTTVHNYYKFNGNIEYLQRKIKSSLYLRHYAKASNEWRGRST